jgi:hypothetical protein
MKRTSQLAITVAATMVFGAAAVLAQSAGTGPGHGAAGHGPMMSQGMGHGMGHVRGSGGRGSMGGPTAMLTKQDAGSAADMSVVMDGPEGKRLRPRHRTRHGEVPCRARET